MTGVLIADVVTLVIAVVSMGAQTTIDPASIPAFVNPYDPALGGINCNEDCSVLATGYEWTEDDYNILAACNPSMMGCHVTFSNDFGVAGPYECRDTGGALLRPAYANGMYVQHFDILFRLTDKDGARIDNSELPWWNYAVFTEWSISC